MSAGLRLFMMMSPVLSGVAASGILKGTIRVDFRENNDLNDLPAFTNWNFREIVDCLVKETEKTESAPHELTQ